MNTAYNSPIDQYFSLKYDDKGSRICGRCKLCLNTTITAEYTSNYWHHLQKFHGINNKEHRKRLNPDVEESPTHYILYVFPLLIIFIVFYAQL